MEVQKKTNEQVVLDNAFIDIAGAIERLSEVADCINRSKLKPKTMLLLLNHMTGVGQREIKQVLEALPRLKATYLK